MAMQAKRDARKRVVWLSFSAAAETDSRTVNMHDFRNEDWQRVYYVW